MSTMKSLDHWILIGFCIVMAGGCVRPYDSPEFVTIEPSQTAFMIPLDTSSEQQHLASEEFLKRAQVATKRVKILHMWVKQGYLSNSGKYLPTVRVVVVERKPVSREWTESASTGTSTKNQGITAESRESIGFIARMNCAAQVDEADAARFLYRYNNKPLEELMDTEVRALVESTFVEECARLNLDQIWVKKDDIMKAVRATVLPYFKERGVTITVLGLKGELTYMSAEIQKAIDQRFTAAQELKSQRDINQRSLEKARADAQAASIISASGNRDYQLRMMEQQFRLRALENQAKAIEKWNGSTPQAVGSGTLLSLPFEIPK